MDHPVLAARKQLTELGLVEDSGKRRPDSAGVMQVVWRISPLGLLVTDYQERFGLTLEQALAMAAETPPKRSPKPGLGPSLPGEPRSLADSAAPQPRQA